MLESQILFFFFLNDELFNLLFSIFRLHCPFSRSKKEGRELRFQCTMNVSNFSVALSVSLWYLKSALHHAWDPESGDSVV